MDEVSIRRGPTVSLPLATGAKIGGMSSEEDAWPDPLIIDWEEIGDDERLARRRQR